VQNEETLCEGLHTFVTLTAVSDVGDGNMLIIYEKRATFTRT